MLKQSRPAVVFLLTMAVGGAILLNQGMQDGPLTAFSVLITGLSRLLIEATGLGVLHSHTVLASADGSFAMRVDNDCNGSWAHLILLASILAYPASWRERLVGIVVGQPVLFALNILRVVSLFFIGVFVPSLFRATHVFVWQFLIIGLALLILFIWVDRVVESQAS